MDLKLVMQELESLGKERTKKIYISNGAHEPLFGVRTGAMKPIKRTGQGKLGFKRKYVRC